MSYIESQYGKKSDMLPIKGMTRAGTGFNVVLVVIQKEPTLQQQQQRIYCRTVGTITMKQKFDFTVSLTNHTHKNSRAPPAILPVRGWGLSTRLQKFMERTPTT